MDWGTIPSSEDISLSKITQSLIIRSQTHYYIVRKEEGAGLQHQSTQNALMLLSIIPDADSCVDRLLRHFNSGKKFNIYILYSTLVLIYSTKD